jgi:uncharacterized protein
MSRENVDTTRRGYEALDRGGVEAMLAFIDPDCVMDVPPDVSPEPQVLHGHDDIRRWFKSAYEALEEIRIEPEKFIEAGECVVVPVRMIGRGRGSGIEAEQRVTQVWTLQNGLAVRMNSYADEESARKAVGLTRTASRPTR